MNQEYLNTCIIGFIQETDHKINTNVFNDVLKYGSKYTVIKEYLTLEMNLPRMSGKTNWFVKNANLFENTVVVVHNNYAQLRYRQQIGNLVEIIEFSKFQVFGANKKIEYLFVDEVGIDKLFATQTYLNSLSETCRVVSLLTR